MQQAFEPGLSLVVGAPRHALGALLAERIADEGRPVVLLATEKEAPIARAMVSRIRERGGCGRVLIGHPTAIDLGVSGAEYLALGRAIREIHHLVSMPERFGARRADDPVRAVQEVLELGEHSPQLERLTVWSSVFASGRRTGSLREEPLTRELAEGAEAASRAAVRADAIAAEARARLPVTLLRTGTIVLEPRLTGELTLGPAQLLVLFLLSRGKEQLFLMPGRADGVLSFLPAEYAVKAGLVIARHPRGARGIFHLVDSDPPTVRRAISILCMLTGREPPHLFVPSLAASALLRAPGLAPRVEHLRNLLEELGSSLEVSDAEARAILEPLGVVCPAFESYAEQLVDEVREKVHDVRIDARSLERAV